MIKTAIDDAKSGRLLLPTAATYDERYMAGMAALLPLRLHEDATLRAGNSVKDLNVSTSAGLSRQPFFLATLQ